MELPTFIIKMNPYHMKMWVVYCFSYVGSALTVSVRGSNKKYGNRKSVEGVSCEKDVICEGNP